MSRPIDWMRDHVRCWLTSDAIRPSDVLRWNAGYGLPPVGYSDEPHVWILRGIDALQIESGADNVCFRAAEKVAASIIQLGTLLSEIPEVDRKDAIRGLFMLAAGLSEPDVLAEPLWQTLQNNVKPKTPAREFSALERRALLAAVICNQLDTRMVETFEVVLQDDKHPYFPARRYDAVLGYEKLPWGRLANERCLDVLTRATARLDKVDRRRYWFERILNAFEQVRGPKEDHVGMSFGEWLLDQAENRGWPAWTNVSLVKRMSDSQFIDSVVAAQPAPAREVTIPSADAPTKKIWIVPEAFDFLSSTVDKIGEVLQGGIVVAKMNPIWSTIYKCTAVATARLIRNKYPSPRAARSALWHELKESSNMVREPTEAAEFNRLLENFRSHRS